MNSQTNLFAGIAAAILAILFPLYWSTIFGSVYSDFDVTFKQDLISLDAKDALFVLIGVLEAGIYLYLSKCLDEYLNTTTARYLLNIMAGLVVLFHLTVLVDIYLAMPGVNIHTETINSMISMTLVVTLISLALFAIIGIVFSIIVLINQALPAMIKTFVLLLLIICILQITVVLAFMNIFLFPAAMIVVSVYFVKEKQEIEVV
ncbi:MAG: hypothetical protein QF552_01040 [Litorilituus sp.]|jgi:hypothetical protein|nr:hypothetical protein [Litorilituus sp.]